MRPPPHVRLLPLARFGRAYWAAMCIPPCGSSVRRALLAVALIGTMAACSDDDGGEDVASAAGESSASDDVGAVPDEPDGTIPPTAGGTTGGTTAGSGATELGVAVADTPYSTIAAEVRVTAPEPVRIDLIATSGDHVVEVPRTAGLAPEHAIPVVGMRAERSYDIEVTAVDAEGNEVDSTSTTFVTGAIPTEFLEYEFEADVERSSPGVTIVEVTPAEGTPYLLGVDEEGEIVWYYQNTGVVGGVEPTPWGTLSSHYWPVGVRDMDVLGNVIGNWQFAASEEGQTVDQTAQEQVIDEDLLESLTAMWEGNPGDPDPLPVASPDVELTSFHHEAWPMDNGNFLVLGTAVHEITPEQRAEFCPDDPSEFDIISDVVVEFEPSGRVVRTWDLWDAIDIEEAPGHELCVGDGPFASETDRDWLHANGVVYDEERDVIIVSARHTNQVIALDHLDEEGAQSDVRWTFGEVGTLPVDGDLPYYQHAPEVQADGTILLYDNGNDRPGTAVGDAESPMYSRAVLYEVDDSSDDPADWTVTQLWEHRTEDVDGSPLYARFLGDADRVANGNVLITHGGIDLPDDAAYQHAVLIEVEPDSGEIVWRMVIGTPDAPATVYRSERLPSLYFGPDWADDAS